MPTLRGCGWSAISYRLNLLVPGRGRAPRCGWSAISYRLNFFHLVFAGGLRCGWSAISYRLNYRFRVQPAHSVAAGPRFPIG